MVTHAEHTTYYTYVDTPVGTLMLAGCRDHGLRYIAFQCGKGAMAPKPGWKQSAGPFRAVERQLREYESAKQSEAAALQTRMTNPLKDKILRAIEDVAKREKLNFVFDRAQEPIMLLLYAESKFDYTNLVLDYLKRGSN